MNDSRNFRYIREEIQNKTANYVQKKGKPSIVPFSKLDRKTMILGEEWFLLGKKLEDAPLKLQHDRGFVSGYNHAVTRDIVNKKLYDSGIEYFEKGINLSEIPENLASNPYFIQGYTDSLKNDNKKSRR